jgi:hypothetical protein
MVFIPQPRSVANENHLAVGSYTIGQIQDHRDGRMPSIWAFRELQVLPPCNGGLGKGERNALLKIGPAEPSWERRLLGFLQSNDSDRMLG